MLAAWTWPILDNINILTFPAVDATKIVVAFVIPQVDEEHRPVLVAKSIVSSAGKKSELVFGYFERIRSHVAHHDVRHIHSLVRAGRRFDIELRDQLASIRTAISDLHIPTPAPEQAISNQSVSNRVLNAITEVQLANSARFILIAVPKQRFDLPSIFESRESTLVQLIDDPPEIRESGFDIGAGGNSRIVEGKYRQAILLRSRLLRIHRDGVIIFLSRGNENGLCWGRRDEQQQALLINQLALVEMTYLFTLLAYRAYAGLLTKCSEFDLVLGLHHLARDGINCSLQGGKLGSGRPKKIAPAADEEFKCTIRFYMDSPERAAFLLVAEVYAWFGLDADQVPYSIGAEGGRKIDPNSIKARHSG